MLIEPCEGGSTSRWGHPAWRLDSKDGVPHVIRARQGFRDGCGDFSFLRSPEGWMDWWVREGTHTLLKRNLPGEPVQLAENLGRLWLLEYDSANRRRARPAGPSAAR